MIKWSLMATDMKNPTFVNKEKRTQISSTLATPCTPRPPCCSYATHIKCKCTDIHQQLSKHTEKKKSSRNPSPLVSPSHSHSHLFSVARIIFFMYSVATPEVRLSGIHLIWPPAVSWWKDKLPTLVSHLNLPRQLLAGRFYNLTNSFITILFECPFTLTSSKGKNADLGSPGPGVIFRKKKGFWCIRFSWYEQKKKDKNGDRNVFACFDHTHTHACTHINKIASTRKHHFKESIRSRLLP